MWSFCFTYLSLRLLYIGPASVTAVFYCASAAAAPIHTADRCFFVYSICVYTLRSDRLGHHVFKLWSALEREQCTHVKQQYSIM